MDTYFNHIAHNNSPPAAKKKHTSPCHVSGAVEFGNVGNREYEYNFDKRAKPMEFTECSTGHILTRFETRPPTDIIIGTYRSMVLDNVSSCGQCPIFTMAYTIALRYLSFNGLI